MEKRKTQVITGEVRFSYAHVWEPSSTAVTKSIR